MQDRSTWTGTKWCCIPARDSTIAWCVKNALLAGIVWSFTWNVTPEKSHTVVTNVGNVSGKGAPWWHISGCISGRNASFARNAAENIYLWAVWRNTCESMQEKHPSCHKRVAGMTLWMVEISMSVTTTSLMTIRAGASFEGAGGPSPPKEKEKSKREGKKEKKEKKKERNYE